MQGKFIVLEGVEGAGKSTNLAFIQRWLSHRGFDVLTTREPGGTPIGEQIRTILLNPHNRTMCVDTEALLMFAARAQHVREKIKPALAQGQWVICDRFVDASYAYQGVARGMPFARLDALAEWTLQGFHAHMTFIFDLPPEVGMARVAARGEGKDRFELEDLSFFARVRQAYLDRAALAPARYAVIDAAQPLPEVQRQIERVLERLI
ncbi:MAG TPA: dTMP kinase [Piscirickettsiaceae bacterium]|nr:dTMP kinase [Piscirickettsiaceae bacterium]HIQ40565.1 dTMP kinase [Sulfurivirga caldicuralii]